MFSFKCFVCIVQNSRVCPHMWSRSELQCESVPVFLAHTFSVSLLCSGCLYILLQVSFLLFCLSLLNNDIISSQFCEKSEAHEKPGLNLLYCS